MKKIFWLFFLFYPVVLFSQPTRGNGTSENPYSGYIATPWTLSGDRYCEDLIVSNGIFTISAGATLRFGSGNSLTISGTGVLSAVGGSSSFITFTASGTSWGHLYFSTTATTNSEIANCIIENGDSRSLSPAYGGGIHINSNMVVITNCTIRNNKSGWGGGIFVNQNVTTSISNSVFYGNTSSYDGGGLYVWALSNATITNCILYSNSASAGGGLFLGDDARDVKIINSDIVNNSAANGTNVRLMLNNNSIRPSFTNCIIWGSASSVSYYGQTPQASDFVYCAIQDPVSGSTTNCITLNATNSDPTGPNFTDPGNRDYSLRVFSPCRDAGTSSGAPATDINGNNRIGNYDIGVWEVQYSRWNGGTTNWGTTSNWDYSMLPGSSSDVVLPGSLSNYPVTGSNITIRDIVAESGSTLNLGSNNLFTASSLRNAGTINVNPSAQGTITSLINNGIINLEAAASGMFSLLIDNYSGSGTTNAKLYLTGGGGPNYTWHYVAVPANMNKDVFTSIDPQNLLQYDDSYVTTSNYQGWVWHDGWIEATQLYGGPGFSSLTFGRGYNFYHNRVAGYAIATAAVTSLATTLPTVNLQYSGGTDNNTPFGLNLLGNSLTCSINWDNVTKGSGLRNAIYFTKDNQMVSYVNGTGVPSGTTGIIPPLQGFFVKAISSNNNTVDFSSAGVRTHGSVNRYKGQTIIPLVRLQLQDISSVKDETLVRFDEKATVEFDSDFDASKLFSANISAAQVYTQIGNENYVINGIPFPVDSYSLPVVIKITEAGNYKIRRTELTGLENYSVKLIDLENNNFSVDLNTTDVYNFYSGIGTFSNRFILKISNILTGTETITKTPSAFNIFYSNNILNIQTLGDDWDGKTGSVKIFDLTGKSISENRNAEFWKNSLVQIPLNSSKGIYLVEMRSGVLRYVGKVVVR